MCFLTKQNWDFGSIRQKEKKRKNWDFVCLFNLTSQQPNKSWLLVMEDAQSHKHLLLTLLLLSLRLFSLCPSFTDWPSYHNALFKFPPDVIVFQVVLGVCQAFKFDVFVVRVILSCD